MIRHPLLLTLLMLFALIAGQGQRVATFDFADRLAVSAAEAAADDRMAVLSPADAEDSLAWAQPLDDGEGGLPVSAGADVHVRTSQAPIPPSPKHIALRHALAYWPTAPPRES